LVELTLGELVRAESSRPEQRRGDPLNLHG